jgi:hypothetical protein
MILRTKFVSALTLLFAIGLLTAYAFTSKPAVISANTPSTEATPTPATPAKLTLDDLKKLRWIEGTWRGTGVTQPAFFERYRWENDTTLAVDSFENEKLEKVTDTTRFELKDGEFGGGSEGARYVATTVDDNEITFAPVVKARNWFVWKRESKDSWTAIIKPVAKPDKPSKDIIYNMERLPDAK